MVLFSVCRGLERWESTPPFSEGIVTTVLLVVVTRVPLETAPLPGLMATVNCH